MRAKTCKELGAGAETKILLFTDVNVYLEKPINCKQIFKLKKAEFLLQLGKRERPEWNLPVVLRCSLALGITSISGPAPGGTAFILLA